MRTLAAALLLLLVPSASAGFGFGEPAFEVHVLPDELRHAENSGEPTIGIPWDTDHVFFQAYSATHRAAFDDATLEDGRAKVEWTDVSPVFNTNINLDPMLVADQRANRIFAGGLAGPCSIMGISDDDGESWAPALNMCSGARFDHQTLGVGAWKQDAVPRGEVARAAYYCGQLGAVACATSVDGGRTWLPFVEVMGGCSGFHGHIRVSEATGTPILPFADCAGEVGFAYSENNGVTWLSRTIPGSRLGRMIGFDPSVHFTTSGWMYYAHGNDLGLFVGLTKDEGLTWETLGNSTPDVTPAGWLNLTAAVRDPQGRPLRYANFVNVVAGDDDRAAIAFLGTMDEGTKPFACTSRSDGLVWHYYLAQTFDAGSTWTTMRLTDDPVQVGGMYDTSEGTSECRNLLDFNDAEIDSHGRVYVAFADGCLEACAKQYEEHLAGRGEKPSPEDSRDSWGALIRQSGGRGVFAKDDVAEPEPEPTPTPTELPDQPVPGPGLPLALLALGAVVAARRRR